MPMPVSETPMIASVPSPMTRIRIVPPGEVYLIAFNRRFETICVEPRRIRVRPDRLGADVDDVTLQPARPRQIAHRPLNAGRRDSTARARARSPGGDVDDIEEVVHQPAEVRDLVTDRLARADRDVVVSADAVEHADRADDGRERIAELVPQHRQELVLRAVRGFRLRARGLLP